MNSFSAKTQVTNGGVGPACQQHDRLIGLDTRWTVKLTVNMYFKQGNTLYRSAKRVIEFNSSVHIQRKLQQT